MIIFTMTCFGQSLFTDNISNATWKSEAHYNDSTIRNSKKIELGRVRHSKDSLKVDVTLWIFKDGSLSIKYYDCQLKKESLVAKYSYEVYADKGILKIILNDNQTLEYEVGIISNGSFICLTRTKAKNIKT